VDYSLYYIAAYFILYSFFGWCFESTVVSISQKRLVNRGFLAGPVCPIYAVGALSVSFSLYPIRDNPIFLYFGGALVATVIEYIIGWGMEAIFKTKWWDYSSHKYQLHGRICLSSSIAWGFLALAMMYFIQPAMEKIVSLIPKDIGVVFEVLIMLYFSIDLTFTVKSIISLNESLAKLNKIKTEIYEQLSAVKELNVSTELKEKLNSFTEKLENKFPAVRNLEVIEKLIQSAGELRENYEEKYGRFNELFLNYKENRDRKSINLERLIKAYPNIKSNRFNEYLTEIKERIVKNKK